MKVKKKCSGCSKKKPLDRFYNNKSRVDGKSGFCKRCYGKSAQKYNRTKKGIVNRIYSNQKSHSIERNHSLPTYSRAQLGKWMLDQYVFHKLYDNWVKSGYDKHETPSIDRIDDYKPYTLDNIQLMTWRENETKGRLDRINGINNKSNHTVSQYTLNGVFIQTFHSIAEAARVTKGSKGNISECCSGNRKSAGGFAYQKTNP